MRSVLLAGASLSHCQTRKLPTGRPPKRYINIVTIHSDQFIRKNGKMMGVSMFVHMFLFN